MTQVFTPPTYDEINNYCIKKKSAADPSVFFKKMQADDWTYDDGTPVENWQEAFAEFEQETANPTASVPSGSFNLSLYTGQVVAWYPPGTDPSPGSLYIPAIVSRMNDSGEMDPLLRTVSLNGVGQDMMGFLVENGEAVPHISNRDKLLTQQFRNGAWDFLPQEKMLHAVINRLELDVNGLKIVVEGLAEKKKPAKKKATETTGS